MLIFFGILHLFFFFSIHITGVYQAVAIIGLTWPKFGLELNMTPVKFHIGTSGCYKHKQ